MRYPLQLGNWPAFVKDSDGEIVADCVCDAETARRVAAALNATRDFTTEGLEQIAEQDRTLEFALSASLRT